MADSSFIVKVGFNYLHRSTEESLFLNMTVWEYLWNYHSVLLGRAKDLVPFLVPVYNSGILNIVSFDLILDRKQQNSYFATTIHRCTLTLWIVIMFELVQNTINQTFFI